MDTLARFRQLAAWLAETDIAWLELRGPQTLLRLGRDGAAAHDDATTGDIVPNRGATLVRAPTLGIVRHRHPLRDQPLAPIGARVECGQAIVLLQIGHLLVPVPAPCEGAVTALLAQDGDAVGYGDPLVELLDWTELD